MTTLKAMVRKPRTDGLYSVYIRIVHNRKPGYIKTDKIVDANHVSNGEITDPVVNEFCAMIIRQYSDRLNRVDASLWSVSEVVDYLLKADEELCFSEYAQFFIRKNQRGETVPQRTTNLPSAILNAIWEQPKSCLGICHPLY